MKAFLLFLSCACLSMYDCCAQTCNGTWGAPIVDQTFGQGDSATLFYGPLSTYAPGVTTTTTFIYSGPSDNYSCLTDNATNGQPGSWVNVTDHTGNPYGLMFEINAPSSGGTVFVKYTMHDLCPNTTLQFSIWVLNIDSYCGCGQQSPNMTMQVVDSATNTVLGSVATGNVPFDTAWHQYTLVFNNGNSSTITLNVINNSVGSGFGNDLALDDITVSPCVPISHIAPKVDTTIACQAAFIPFTANISGNVYSPATYQWQYSADMGATWVNAGPADTTATYYFTASAIGTYWVRFLTGPAGFTGNSSCSAVSDTSVITIATATLPPPVVSSPVAYCQNAIANALTAAGKNLIWYATDTSTVPLPGAPLPNTSTVDTSYYYVIQQSGNCISTPDSIEVIIKPLPVLTVTSNSPVCSGATLELKASSSVPGVSYNWTGPDEFIASGSDQSVSNVTVSGSYTAVASLNGCTDTATDSITVNPLPDATISTNVNGPVCVGDSLLLVIDNYDSSDSYQWLPADAFENSGNHSPAFWLRAAASGDVYLTATTSLGCTATDSLYIITQPCCIVTFPNAFTPNNDGNNDVFRAITVGNYNAFYLLVVNRWGQTVFETYNEHGAWDGTFNGTPQDIGVYQYFARYDCNGHQIEKKGEVTLIR